MIQEASSFSDLLLCLTQLLSAYLTDHHNDRSSKHLWNINTLLNTISQKTYIFILIIAKTWNLTK
jgi:hypothetical protein